MVSRSTSTTRRGRRTWLSEAVPGLARRVSGHRIRGRSRRWHAVPSHHGGIHRRQRFAAHVLLVRHAWAGLLQGAFRGLRHQFEQASQEFSGGTSWPCWAFSNHDVVRHMSRWISEADDHDRLARLAGSLLLSLKGSVCVYQGEELGLTEAELRFEELTDPYGINFWPEFKGRDGCRTPMVWESGAAHAGFSTADSTWLPVTDPHLAAAADRQTGDPQSVLEHYRRFLRFRRKRPSLVTGESRFLPFESDGIAFIRSTGDEATLCVFNLSSNPQSFAVPDESTSGRCRAPASILHATAAPSIWRGTKPSLRRSYKFPVSRNGRQAAASIAGSTRPPGVPSCPPDTRSGRASLWSSCRQPPV